MLQINIIILMIFLIILMILVNDIVHINIVYISDVNNINDNDI